MNKKANINRKEYDQLKAILTNCIRYGIDSQNRENHPQFKAQLHGKIAHIYHINTVKGQKLIELLQQIK